MRWGAIGAAVRWLPLALALAGVFAMHGLSDHGTTGPSGMAMSHSMSHDAAAPVAPAAPVEMIRAPTPSHGDAMAMGLCVALLVAAGVVLGCWRRVSTSSDGLVTRAEFVSLAVPRARSPDLLALGVCRC
ncbi:hypothetical protein D9V37_19460 [Nocardioides mangrovicus]|uniref:Uncharacterized protein n=1 Tax=Nocardioides mangrovicus TaxID=2478913 RepID=A0A3L8NZ99_9ACTN|nr:DUF6153 family protein [Nocardioides mangrovicus]RLV48234.1 hypothetical protein D9V37_19460 [Nocardioides mangrovicus]